VLILIATMINIKTELTDKGLVSTLVHTNSALNKGLSTKTTAKLDYYVDDVSGNDANNGSSTSPFKTYAAAVAKIPDIVSETVTIHLAPHSGTGYDIATIENKLVAHGKMIHVTGDDNFTELLASTAAAAGSGTGIVVGTGFITDAYLGKTIEILTGAAAGDRRSIRNNTTTGIIPVRIFSAAVSAGDTYRVVEPSVAFMLPLSSLNSNPTQAVRNCPGIVDKLSYNSTAFIRPGSSVVFSNVRVASTGDYVVGNFIITNSSVVFWGVELYPLTPTAFCLIKSDKNSMVQGGLDLDGLIPKSLLPYEHGLASTITSWSGWGVSSYITNRMDMQYYKGFLCSTRTVTLEITEWRIMGGSFNKNASDSVFAGALGIMSNSNLKIANASPVVLIRSSSNNLINACMKLWAGATAEISNTTFIKTNSGAGIVLLSAGNGQGARAPELGLNSNITITGISSSSAPNYGISVSGGAILNFINDIIMSGWPANQQMAIRTSPPGGGTTIEAKDKSVLTAAGMCLPSPGISDGRYGYIRRL